MRNDKAQMSNKAQNPNDKGIQILEFKTILVVEVLII
jgi:hypothetical protein